ncbi:hypothetical protein RLV_2076 (plasmid) [Rhizobium leguminosarum bv. viciae]|nr:hypothetical protein RLV_2076 [Rhizobium leguminosarum bv. viciae]
MIGVDVIPSSSPSWITRLNPGVCETSRSCFLLNLSEFRPNCPIALNKFSEPLIGAAQRIDFIESCELVGLIGYLPEYLCQRVIWQIADH